MAKVDYRVVINFDAGQPKGAAAELERALKLASTAGANVQARLEAVSGEAKRHQRELLNVTRAYERVRGQLDPTARATLEYEKQQRILNAALRAGVTTQAEHTRLLGLAQQQGQAQVATTGSLTTAVRGLATGYAALKAIDLARDAFATTQAWQAQTKALETAAGSAKAAAGDMAFLSSTAATYGLKLNGLVGTYANFSKASKSLGEETTRELFLGVAEAATALQRDGAATNSMLKAFVDMASKGTVQAEELRGQLGEHLPGAFKMAADAMGVSERELGKMMERGELTAQQLLPALARELRATFGADALRNADSMTAQMNRFANAVDAAKVAFGTGASEGLGAALKSGADGMKPLAEVAHAFGVSLGAVTSALAGLFVAVDRFTNPGYDALFDLLFGMSNPGAASLNAQALEELATAMDGVHSRTVGLGAATEQFVAAMVGAQSSGKATAEQMRDLEQIGEDLALRWKESGEAVPVALRRWLPAIEEVKRELRVMSETFHTGTGFVAMMREFHAATKAPVATGPQSAVAEQAAWLARYESELERVAAARAEDQAAAERQAQAHASLLAGVRDQIAEQEALVAALQVSRQEYDLVVAAQALGFNVADGLSKVERELTAVYLDRQQQLTDLVAAQDDYAKSTAAAAAAAVAAATAQRTAIEAAEVSIQDGALQGSSFGNVSPEAYESVSQSAKEMAKALRKGAEESKALQDAADDAAERWNGAAESVAAVFGDAFRKMRQGGQVQIEDLALGVLDVWGNMLEQMLEQWIANQLKMQGASIATGGGSGGGVGVGSVAGAGQSAYGAAGAGTMAVLGVFAAAIYAWHNDRQHEYEAISGAIQDIQDVFEGLSDTLGQYLPALTASVQVRKDGDRYRANVGTDAGGAEFAYFDEYGDAIGAAILSGLREQLSNGSVFGPGTLGHIGEEARNVLEGITDEVIRMGQAGVEWIQEGLALARQLDELGMTDMERTLQALRREYDENIRKGAEYGLSLAKIGDLYRQQLADIEASLRSRVEQYLPGYDPVAAEFERIRADNAALQAEYAKQREALQKHIEQVIATIAAISSGVNGGGTAGGVSPLNQVDEYMRQLMGIGGGIGTDNGRTLITGMLEELEAIEAMGNLLGGGGGLSPDTVARIAQQRALLEDLMRQLEAMPTGGLTEEEIAAAEREARRRNRRGGRGGPSQEELQGAFNEELDRLTRQLLPDGQREIAELDAWLAEMTARAIAAGAPLDRVNELYAEQVERLQALEAEQREQRRTELRDRLASFGANPYHDIFVFAAEMREALIELRESAEEFGYTAEDVARWSREIGQSQMISLLDRMAQYLDDEQLNLDIAQFKWTLERNQMALQIHLLAQQATLLGLTADEIQRMWDLWEQLPEDPPVPPRGGGGGVGDYGGQPEAESAADLLSAFADFMAQWRDRGLSDIERELSQITSEFDEALIRFARIPGAVAQLQALEIEAISAVFDDVLERYQTDAVDPLQRELDEINETFAELIRLAPQYGQSVQEIAAAQAAALEEFWNSAMQPIEDWLDQFNLSNLSPLTPEQRLADAQQNFDSLVERALAGDLSALSQIPGAAQALLAEGAGMFGTAGTLYQDLWAMVQAVLQQVLGLGGGTTTTGGGGGVRPGGGGGTFDSPGGGLGQRFDPIVVPGQQTAVVNVDLSPLERHFTDLSLEVRRMREELGTLAAAEQSRAASFDRVARAVN